MGKQVQSYKLTDAREYLGQAYRIDQRINSKLEQITSLRDLSMKATSTMSDVPASGTRNVYRMGDTIAKIVDMENEINTDINRLIHLKAEIMQVIKNVDNLECQTLLELRYLCFKTWEQIAVDMDYSIQHIYRIRDKALEKIVVPNKDDREC